MKERQEKREVQEKAREEKEPLESQVLFPLLKNRSISQKENYKEEIEFLVF